MTRDEGVPTTFLTRSEGFVGALPKWVPVEKSWAEFSKPYGDKDSAHELCEPGVVLRVSRGGRDTRGAYVAVEDVIVGDVNVNAGACDCCRAISDDDIVVAALDCRNLLALARA